jgi:hypothetical protein
VPSGFVLELRRVCIELFREPFYDVGFGFPQLAVFPPLINGAKSRGIGVSHLCVPVCE